jgi:hypothetical protein
MRFAGWTSGAINCSGMPLASKRHFAAMKHVAVKCIVRTALASKRHFVSHKQPVDVVFGAFFVGL